MALAENVLDIRSNRIGRKYEPAEMVRRIIWLILLPVFRIVPRPMFWLRCAILRLLGAKVGRHVHIYGSATVYFPWLLEIGDWSSIGEHAYIYNLGKITIGDRATISQRAHICAGTHDYTKPDLPLLRPPVSIGSQAWICADAFIGPGVAVGEGAVAGARAVVTKDIAPWTVVAGNPARVIKSRVIEGCPP